MSVYLHLFHGRISPDMDMEDIGADGPTLGPLEYVHTTYLSDVKFATKDHKQEGHFGCYEGLIYYGGVFYGDFSVTTLVKTECTEDITPKALIMPPIVRVSCQKCRHTERRACDAHPLECSSCGFDRFNHITKQEDQPNED